MKRTRRKQAKNPPDVDLCLSRLPNWRSPFDSQILIDFAKRDQDALKEFGPRLANMLDTCRTDVSTGVLEHIFGAFHQHHSFNAPFLNWHFKLSEPNVTQTLAMFLNEGPDDVKARRIHAFLVALKTPDIPELDRLSHCIVMAEKDRIDLEIWIPQGSSGQYRPVIVEAKFGHKVTQGQLSKYTGTRRKDKVLIFKERHCVLLALDDTEMKNLVGKQNNIWKFVAWRDLWLTFEKLRPREDNPSLSIFLRQLWHRIGQLN